MNNGIKAIMALSFAAGLGGCVSTPSVSNPDPAHNSQNSLDWAGSYKGVLPCADCEGIETVVTLKPDGQYVSTTRYMTNDSKPQTQTGTFAWDKTGGVIILSGDEPARYRVEEGRLVRLALDGSIITGPLAQHYVLAKMEDGIREKYWKLTELRGQPVPKLEREAFFILHSKDNRVSGFNGCNNITGSYTLDEARMRISFGQMASTMMACIGGDASAVEKEFSAVLGMADNYSVSGDTMTLNRARMAPLARFEAVYLK